MTDKSDSVPASSIAGGIAIGVCAFGLVCVWPAHSALLLVIVGVITAR